ncbi:CdaR family transcriptional regulator [Curtobacterium sp. VKM Ac-2922]|uniref:PucR family transcriptional regulator n=1 Tax=Curtobacterium sp. VKM Ac-2922 TaxID=2929475 RepID=UPI001FB2A60E|nr:helix-turn-helix domain-containing protein [Curtobacterium sp. VKM Ac-2922]MCJ1712924.1 helix-turn-helix domain-containing protein [Curtobacterium sp. VKM Ac-2922]
MIPVGELVPLLPAGTAVLAGPTSGTADHVRGIVGPPEQVGRAINPGDGIVALLTPVDRFDARFDVLLRRAAAAGVPALLVGVGDVGRASPSVGPGTAALAERLGVGIIVTPDPWAASVRVHELLGSGDAPAARAALAAARIGLDAGPALDEVFTRLASELGHPVRFLDASGRPLRGDGVAPDTAALLARTLGTSDPVWATDADGETVVAVPVPTGIGPRAWLAVGLTVPLPAERATVAAALQVAAVAVGHRLVLTRLDDERDARYRMAMLDDLRAADGAPAPPLVQRTLAAGWELDAWHIGIRLVARQPVDAVALRREVETAFGAHDLPVVVVEQADGWALWTSVVDEPDRVTVAGVAAAVRSAQNTLRSAVDTNAGVGSVHAGPAGLVRTLGEAGDAARLAAGRPESGWFVHVDRLGLAQLLLAWTQTDTFLPAAEQLLAPLERGGGVLRATLAAYLDAESSVAETAAVLGVHRNTVWDRIARIERLIGVDLKDPETRLALHLATRALGAAD